MADPVLTAEIGYRGLLRVVVNYDPNDKDAALRLLRDSLPGLSTLDRRLRKSRSERKTSSSGT